MFFFKISPKARQSDLWIWLLATKDKGHSAGSCPGSARAPVLKRLPNNPQAIPPENHDRSHPEQWIESQGWYEGDFRATSRQAGLTFGIYCINKYNNFGWSGNEIATAPDVPTPEEELSDDPKFRKIDAPMIKLLNLLASGPNHQVRAGSSLDLIEHLWGYVKRFCNGVIIGAGDGIR